MSQKSRSTLHFLFFELLISAFFATGLYVFRIDYSNAIVTLSDKNLVCDIWELESFLRILWIVAFSITIVLTRNSFLNKYLSIICLYATSNLSFILAQYPAIQQPDTFFHSIISKWILTEGKIPFDKSDIVPYVLYPSSNVLTSILALVSEVKIPEIVLLSSLLISIIHIVLLLILFLLIQRRKSNENRCWILPLAVAAVGLLFRRHFSPSFFIYFVNALFVYLLLQSRLINRRATKIAIILLIFSVVPSYPLAIFILGASTLFFIIIPLEDVDFFSRVKIGCRFIMMIAVAWFSWFIYVALISLQMEVKSIFEALIFGNVQVIQYVERIGPTLDILSVDLNSFILAFVRWVMLFCIVSSYLSIFVKLIRKKKRFDIAEGFSLIMVFAIFAMYVSLLFSPIVPLERTITFNFWILSAITVDNILKGMNSCQKYKNGKYHVSLNKKMIKTIFAITMLILVFVSAHPPYVFFNYRPLEYLQTVRPYEISLSSFIVRTGHFEKIMGTDQVTVSPIFFYADESKFILEKSSAGTDSVAALISHVQTVIISFRETLTYYSLRKEFKTPWDAIQPYISSVNIIYDSQYALILNCC